MALVTNRGRMQGFIILDFLPRAMEAIEQLMDGWHRAISSMRWILPKALKTFPRHCNASIRDRISASNY